jgi:DNA uptake protein ComE-like DNA-binding protein
MDRDVQSTMMMKDDRMAEKINLNTASREELAKVPGSSEHCADQIIWLRQERGGLRSVDEIDYLKGFGEAGRHFREDGTV